MDVIVNVDTESKDFHYDTIGNRNTNCSAQRAQHIDKPKSLEWCINELIQHHRQYRADITNRPIKSKTETDLSLQH